MKTVLMFAPLILATIYLAFGCLLIFSSEIEKSKNKKRQKKTTTKPA